jgi:hypothetical protein
MGGKPRQPRQTRGVKVSSEVPRRLAPALALEQLRRWFECEVELARTRINLAKLRIDHPVSPADVPAKRRWKRPPTTPATILFDTEIEKAARGEPHKPVEWLWILHVDSMSKLKLRDEVLAQILKPGKLESDRRSALRDVAKQRKRAHVWYESQTCSELNMRR